MTPLFEKAREKAAREKKRKAENILQVSKQLDPETCWDTDIEELLYEGNAEAQFIMGNRWSTRGKSGQAALWYKQAADQGHTGAKRELEVIKQQEVVK